MCALGVIQYRKSVAEEGGMNTGHTWTQSGLQVENSRKSPRDLDNHGFLAGCESLVRRREKMDRIGKMQKGKTVSFENGAMM